MPPGVTTRSQLRACARVYRCSFDFSWSDA
jgi:hypothetical protein